MMRLVSALLILINLQHARADEETAAEKPAKSPFIELEIEEREDAPAADEREPASEAGNADDSGNADNADSSDGGSDDSGNS